MMEYFWYVLAAVLAGGTGLVSLSAATMLVCIIEMCSLGGLAVWKAGNVVLGAAFFLSVVKAVVKGPSPEMKNRKSHRKYQFRLKL